MITLTHAEYLGIVLVAGFGTLCLLIAGMMLHAGVTNGQLLAWRDRSRIINGGLLLTLGAIGAGFWVLRPVLG